MNKLDYLVVGQGFAGSFLAYDLLQRKKSFLLIDAPDLKSASSIAAGVYNPVVLKRFNPIWEAEEQVEYLRKKIKEIESFLGENFLNENPVYRIFHDEKEKETWIQKSEKPNLNPFLSKSVKDRFTNLYSPFGASSVQHSGRVHVQSFLKTIRDYLLKNGFMKEAYFEYNLLHKERDWHYKEWTFQHVIFAEGSQVLRNPYFDFLPIRLNKGECLQFKLQKPLEDYIFKKRDFLFPLAKDKYYIGGTYNPGDTTPNPTVEAKTQLVNNFKEIYKSPYEIISHQAAFRPTTPDRRPIIGNHPHHENLHILNGLGSRGTLLGAKFSSMLIAHIEENTPIDDAVNIQRFC